jgi:hypothetical protein
MQTNLTSPDMRQQFSDDASKTPKYAREIAIATLARLASRNVRGTRSTSKSICLYTLQNNIDVNRIMSNSITPSQTVTNALYRQDSVHELDQVAELNQVDKLHELDKLDQHSSRDHSPTVPFQQNPPSSSDVPEEDATDPTETHIAAPVTTSPNHSNHSSTVYIDHGRIDPALRIVNLTVVSNTDTPWMRDSTGSYVRDHGTIQQTLGAFLQVTNPDTSPMPVVPITSYPYHIARPRSNAPLRLVNALPEVDPLPDTTRLSQLGPAFSKQARDERVRMDDDREDTVHGGRPVVILHRSASAKVLQPYKTGLEKAQEYIDSTLDQCDGYRQALSKRLRRMLGCKDKEARKQSTE